MCKPRDCKNFINFFFIKANNLFDQHKTIKLLTYLYNLQLIWRSLKLPFDHLCLNNNSILPFENFFIELLETTLL